MEYSVDVFSEVDCFDKIYQSVAGVCVWVLTRACTQRMVKW